MSTSLNGWPAFGDYGDPNLATGVIPGTKRNLTACKRALPLLLHFCAAWHAEMPARLKLDTGPVDGFEPRDARGGGGISNHGSGTAVDLRYDVLSADNQRHMTDAEIAILKRILGRYTTTDGHHVLANGYAWNSCDEMHTELSQGWDVGAKRYTTPADVAEVIKRLGIKADGTAGAPVPPKPVVTPTIPAGKGPEWTLKFLRAVGCPSKLERAWFSIIMRESGGDAACVYPAGSPKNGWNTAQSPYFDTGVLQVNNRHLDSVKKMFGATADMSKMLDPVAAWTFAQKNLHWLDWGLRVSDDGSSYVFDWTGWPSGWVSSNAAASEAGFKQWWDAYPKHAATPTPTPKPPTPKPPVTPGLPIVKVSDVQPGKSNASVLLVQKALAKTVGLDYSSGPGTFGPRTIAAYAAEQRAQGFSGSGADGAPGVTSLTTLGTKTGLFKVVS